jgi:hypothetical protein
MNQTGSLFAPAKNGRGHHRKSRGNGGKRHAMKGKPFSHNKPEWRVQQEQKQEALKKNRSSRRPNFNRQFESGFPRIFGSISQRNDIDF